MIRCGIDSISIARVQQSMDRFGDRFLRRFFTPAEVAYCGPVAARLAARIAAKEAVAKALGTGIGAVSWREIEIDHDEQGRPILLLHGNAIRIAQELGLQLWDVSLTHTDDVASAVCIMQ